MVVAWQQIFLQIFPQATFTFPPFRRWDNQQHDHHEQQGVEDRGIFEHFLNIEKTKVSFMKILAQIFPQATYALPHFRCWDNQQHDHHEQQGVEDRGIFEHFFKY